MSETVSTDTTPEVEKTEKKDSDNTVKASDKKSNNSPKKKSWFAGMKAEFKKVVWPDRQTVIKSTTAVVLVSVFTSVLVKVSDLLIQAVLDLLL